jgi:His-Xaa-Ser system protein HxsD
MPESSDDTSEATAIEMSWATSTTPLEAVERSLYALADQVTGVVSESGPVWEVLVYPRSASANRERLAHQMRQEVTDQTLRLRIAERTDPIRNLVFALAFSRSPQSSDIPSVPEETIVS